MSKQTSHEGHETSESTMPLLGAISAFLRWVEELVVLLSGPMLTVGLGIGLVSLLSDGKLLVDAPWLLYAWAVAQAVGVDGQIVGVWYRVSVAVSQRRWGVMLAFALLGLVLGYVGYIAALVFAQQEAYGISTAEALSRLGLDSTSWLWQRAAISVFLVCLSGYLRYRAPRADTRSLEEKKRELREQMELDALRQEQRAQLASGLAALVRSTVAAARGSQERADQARTAEEAPEGVASEENTGETTARPFAEARR